MLDLDKNKMKIRMIYEMNRVHATYVDNAVAIVCMVKFYLKKDYLCGKKLIFVSFILLLPFIYFDFFLIHIYWYSL